MTFFVWFLSLSIMFSRFIHVVAYISISVLIMAKYSIIWLYTILFIYLSVVGHLVFFYFLAITNNAFVNICVRIFVWIYVFISLGYIPRSRIVGSYGNSL